MAGIAGERREFSFDAYLRTGRLVGAEGLECKFNHYHDPENGRFTFAGTGVRSEVRAQAGERPRAKRHKEPVEYRAYRQVELTPAEYSRQAKDLWKTVKPDRNAGFKDDAAVSSAAKRVAQVQPRSTHDVEAPEDVRSSVLLIADETAKARLGDNADGEKTVTLARKADGTVVIASVQAVGPQGGHVAGVNKTTIAVAHVHGKGLEHTPGPADHSSVISASVPSFVIIGDTGVVWEVGRQGGAYVRRQIKKSGEAGTWQPFRSE